MLQQLQELAEEYEEYQEELQGSPPPPDRTGSTSSEGGAAFANGNMASAEHGEGVLKWLEEEKAREQARLEIRQAGVLCS